MSPASKSKSKSKAKAVKEQKNASKTSGSSTTGNGSSASAYNPLSGTFHLLETSSIASSPPSANGRFQNIDDTDEHSSSPHGTVSEYDSVSNNGSCSGESEDLKDKIGGSGPQQETLSAVDNDRREKIRLKNEKKHQRQRERRAQELHERCTGYLMSRKLEALSQQLVNMGFSSERATLALILNEGRLEDSVSWLFEGSEEEAGKKDTDLGSRSNLKIDITEELSQISELESKCKCTKQEVERAVVACEGDLVKAEESLRTQKQDQQPTPSKPPTASDTKNLLRPQEKTVVSTTIPQRRNERDFNYTKAASAVPTDSDLSFPDLQSLKPNQQISMSDQRWHNTGSSPPLTTNIAMRRQISPPTLLKTEALHGVKEEKIVQQAAIREPVTVMQRPQSILTKQNPVSSLSHAPSGLLWSFPGDAQGAELLRSNVKLLHAQRFGNLAGESQGTEQLYHQAAYKESLPMFGQSDASLLWNTMGRSPLHIPPSEHQDSWSSFAPSSQSLAVPSSRGLFSSWKSGSLGSSSQVDWSTGSMTPEFDYNSVDWTLDTNLAAAKSSGMSSGLSSFLRNGSSMQLGAADRIQMSRWRDIGVSADAPSAGPCEWTSPFAGKDIFSLPRQFVTSPSPQV